MLDIRARGSLFILAAALAAAVSLSGSPQTKQAPPAKTKRPAQAAAARPAPRDPVAEAIRLNNLGVAYMNQQRHELALKQFEQAAALDTKLFAARLNQGIALLNLQRIEPARKILLEGVARQPSSIRAWYNLGLLHRAAGEAEKALAAFGKAAQLDPNDADAQYFIGMMHSQLQQQEQAIAAFERAIALDRFHASAEFGLARAYQRAGNEEKTRQHLARFQKLTQEKLGTPMSLAYGDQGQYSLAEQVAVPASAVPSAISVKFTVVPPEESGLRFVSAGAPGRDVAASPSGGCILDYDNDGRPDLLLLNSAENGAAALYRNSGNGRSEDATRKANLSITRSKNGCTAGDYDNDGWMDVAVVVAGGMALLRNQGGKFQDVTAAAGVKPPDTGVSNAVFLDFDHDGDLDLCLLGELGPSQVWRNNGNGTFTDVTQATGLLQGKLFLSAVGTDFNNDRAMDLVVTGAEADAAIYLNPREGRFARIQPGGSQLSGTTFGVAVLDFNKDGWMDLVFTGERAPTLWRNVQGKQVAPVVLPKFEWNSSYGVAPIDFDNDGWVDLAFVGERAGRGEIRLLRNRGPAGFEDVTPAVGLAGLRLNTPTALLTADYDGDGDTDLLITQNGGPAVLVRNDGGNKNNWLKISLKGLADNKSAIGTKVEVFAGAMYQKFEVQSSSGYLGQNSMDILVGLGHEKQADIVRLLWPTGVLQDEVNLPARTTQRITELDRRGSSCPILFAWNGTRYEFVADAIGPGIVGHWVAPGERNISDPDEYVKVNGARVRLRNSRLSFRFMEPMEELVYLDQLRLLAVDHPADADVYPNERFYASGPPFPEFKVIASRNARPPAGAWDEQGHNVLPELAQRDRRYVTGFADAPYKGFAKTHWIELDLGEAAARAQPAAPLQLLLHGFTDYFTATSVYAAQQSGVTAIVPYVEALDARGQWVRVVDDMGFPAGLARTMVTDLTGRLPAGTRRIRIVTNLKVYWDQILMDTTPEGVPVRLSEAPLAEATLAFRGYPRELRGHPTSDISYDYQSVSRTGPYARPAGNYTRYGDVKALVATSNDHFVIFGSGEEIAAEFDPSALPPLPAGWMRDYFFYVDGFAKDMDFYAAHFDTVEPLPYHTALPYPYPAGKEYPASGAYLDYQLNFNTRQVSGRGAPAYRFVFPPSQKKKPSP